VETNTKISSLDSNLGKATSYLGRGSRWFS